MTENIASLSSIEFFLFLTLGLGVTLIGLYWANQSLKIARLIEDVPTAKIRSASQGYVELEGFAEMLPGEPIIAPLSNVPCCWYRYRVERRMGKKWQAVKSGVSDGLFLIKDDTGFCVIDPDDAKVTIEKEETWSGDSAMPMVAGGNIMQFGSTSLFSPYRYSESVLLPGQRLYAMGQFKTTDDVDHLRNRKELSGEILREWKRNPQAMQQQFDNNKDGTVDVEEWQQAVKLAKKKAAEQYIELMQNQHLHLLSCPTEKRHPFILSFLPPNKLIRQYRWQSIGGVILFFIAGSISTLLLTVRLL